MDSRRILDPLGHHLLVWGVDANAGAGSSGTVAVCKPTSIKIRFE
jgi:hypothetical protein